LCCSRLSHGKVLGVASHLEDGGKRQVINWHLDGFQVISCTPNLSTWKNVNKNQWAAGIMEHTIATHRTIGCL
jgi:hypothetical protein